MGFAIAIDESLLKLQENYRRAFRDFAQAVEELISLQESDDAEFSQIHAANVRIRDTQETCRDARDKLATLLLARRRENLVRGLAGQPAHSELLTLVTRLELLLANNRGARQHPCDHRVRVAAL